MTEPERSVVAVVLAAGQGGRMGFPKALLDFGGGESFLDHLAAVLTRAGAKPLAVLGADAATVRERHPWLWAVDNPAWETGQWSSVRAGLEAALAAGAQQVVVQPVDAPRIQPATVHKVLAALDGAPAAVAHHRGAAGHPVALTAEGARAVLWDRSAQALSQALAALGAVPVELGDLAIVENFNLPEEYLQAFGRPPRAR